MPYYPTNKINTIEYDSPSGKININKWVPPFKDVPDGYGFMGVVAEDVGTGKLQCAICGKWYEGLTTHIWLGHNIKTREYKEKFGLFRGTALRSMRIRKIQSKTMLGMRKKHAKHRHKFSKGDLNKGAANRKGLKKPLENKNRYGVCDLQVIDKIKILRDKLGKTPALTELIDEYGGGFAYAIHNTYGSYIKLLRNNGMEPVTSSHNPKYSKKYFIQMGVNAIMDGKELKGTHILSINEQRYVYKYFPSQTEWKKAVIKELIMNKDY